MVYDVFWRISGSDGSSWTLVTEVFAGSHDEAHRNVLRRIEENYTDCEIAIRSYNVDESQVKSWFQQTHWTEA